LHATAARPRGGKNWFWLPIVATIETSSKACGCIPLRLVRVVAKIGNQIRLTWADSARS